MIGYVTLETARFKKAEVFYDKLLGAIGAIPCVRVPNKSCMYGIAAEQAMFGIVSAPMCKSADSGVAIAFRFDTRNEVDQVYQLALSLGAAGDEPPGVRDARNAWFYEAAFRDLDGNRLTAYCHGPVDQDAEAKGGLGKTDRSTDLLIKRFRNEPDWQDQIDPAPPRESRYELEFSNQRK